MRNFDIGEHVVCAVTAEQAGTLVDVTSNKISIYLPTGVIDISAVDMARNSVGTYHYDYASAGKAAGYYRVIVTVTLAGRITIRQGGFTLS